MERHSQTANILIANSIDMLDVLSFRAVNCGTDLAGKAISWGGEKANFNLRLLM
jgi:hypothetical protein